MRSKQPRNFEINLLTKTKKKTNPIFIILLIVVVLGLLFAGYMWYKNKDGSPEQSPNENVTDEEVIDDEFIDDNLGDDEHINEESLDYGIYEEVTGELDTLDDLQLFDYSDSETVLVNITLDSEDEIDRFTDMMSDIRNVDSVSVNEPKEQSDDRVNVLFRLNILSD